MLEHTHIPYKHAGNMYQYHMPLQEQIKILTKKFPVIDPTWVMTFAAYASRSSPHPKLSMLSELSPSTIHWCAFLSERGIRKVFPKVQSVHECTIQYVRKVVEMLRSDFSLHVSLASHAVHTAERTQRALDALKKHQESDIGVIAIQRGNRFINLEPRLVPEKLDFREFCLPLQIGVTLALTHPNLFSEENRRCMDLPGTEVSINHGIIPREGRFTEAAFIRFAKRRLIIASTWNGNMDASSGTATGFVPEAIASEL